MKRYTDYDAFAWLYNREWAFFGDNIFPGLRTIARDRLPDKSRILDLCCGTGQLAKVLIQKGYEVSGIDGSDRMLRYARKNAPAAKFSLGDARVFSLPAEYNAVFSTFDALNHIMTLEELEQVFKNVFACLVNGGIFIFDMTMKMHFESVTRNHNNIQEKPEYLYLARVEYDADKKLSQITITIFQPEGKLWKRSEIVLYQTWYPLEDIKAALTKAGFTDFRAHSFNQQRELQEATDDSDRAFFYVQKPWIFSSR